MPARRSRRDDVSVELLRARTRKGQDFDVRPAKTAQRGTGGPGGRTASLERGARPRGGEPPSFPGRAGGGPRWLPGGPRRVTAPAAPPAAPPAGHPGRARGRPRRLGAQGPSAVGGGLVAAGGDRG